MIRTRFTANGKNLRPLATTHGGGEVAATRTSKGDLLGAAFGGSDRVTASIVPTMGTDIPTLAMPLGGTGFSKMFTGILPDVEESLLPYYRDCYYFDSVAGATVDLMSTFPFSDFSLVGLEKDETDIFSENLARLNIRSLMAEVSNAYLVDGAFIGSLVYDPKSKSFQDIMVHDRQNCQISLRPFFSLDPVITANAAPNLNSFLNSSSPYVEAVLASYPRNFLDIFAGGAVILDPLTTIYLPRRGALDLQTTSYLRRILPMYILEKTLYRGTLIEATKRMRATTLVTAGTDTWEPTPGELQTIMGQMQMAEMDPLGGWIVTRNGISVQDIRQGGEFWKWTDLIDTLVPYKLRALGVSEAFLAGDASYNSSEVAMTVFTENAAAYRSNFDHRLFRDKLFPLIAVSNGLYRDEKKVDRSRSATALIRNLGNHKNLRIPEIRWNKTLDNHDPQMMDTLEKLGEKGIPVPLKMWAAAGNVSMDMLLGDLEGDKALRDKIAAITGVHPDDAGNADTGGEEDGMGYQEASLRNLEATAEFRSGKNPILSKRRSILQRDFKTPSGTPLNSLVGRMSKSGKVIHSVVNERAAEKKQNEYMIKAAIALQDPEHRKKIRDQIIAKAGRIPNLL